jgi:succinyl-diaminopimelate desuccinylase
MPHLGDNAVTKLAAGVLRLASYEFPDASHPVMGGPTLNIGTFHGGFNTNSVPDRAEATVDVRTVAGQEHASVLADLRACAEVTLEPLIDLPPVWTDPTGEWAASVALAVQEITGVPASPLVMTYFTDASVLTPAFGGVPTVICGPGEPALAHVTDEWCSISKLDQSVAILERLCRDWCGL